MQQAELEMQSAEDRAKVAQTNVDEAAKAAEQATGEVAAADAAVATAKTNLATAKSDKDTKVAEFDAVMLYMSNQALTSAGSGDRCSQEGGDDQVGREEQTCRGRAVSKGCGHWSNR